MYLFIYLSMYLSINLSMYLSLYLSIYVSIYVSLYISIYVSFYLPVEICIVLILFRVPCVSLSLTLFLSLLSLFFLLDFNILWTRNTFVFVEITFPKIRFFVLTKTHFYHSNETLLINILNTGN